MVHQISDHLRAVPSVWLDSDWWDLQVFHNGEWTSVQGGPRTSSLWHKLGVHDLPEIA